MADELTSLKDAVATLEATLSHDDYASIKLKLEFSLLQIRTALTALTDIQASATSNHTKYLLYKQLESTINDIQTNLKADSRDHDKAQQLTNTAEFSALTAAKPFLVQQQKEWLPYYLEHDLINNFNSKLAKSKVKTICDAIHSINLNRQLSAEDKTKRIDEIITIFANSKGPAFSIFKDPIKSEAMEWLAIHREAIIYPLFNPPPKPGRP